MQVRQKALGDSWVDSDNLYSVLPTGKLQISVSFIKNKNRLEIR